MCDALRYFKDEEYVGIFALNESRYVHIFATKKSSLEKILIQPFSGKIGASLISRYISAHTRLGRPVSSMYVLSSGKCSYARLWHGGLK